MKKKIAIVGAGISGLVLAYELEKQADAEVQVFEKARGVGGRMSTRYTDTYQFDHGVPFFTARSPKFKRFLTPWIEQGVVQDWQPNVTTLSPGKTSYKRDWFEPHYVGVPKMNAFCKALTESVNVSLGVHIESLVSSNTQWQLTDSAQTKHGPFDWVVSTAPLPQAQMLMPELCGKVPELKNVTMSSAYSLMLGFDKPLDLTWGAAKLKHECLSWIMNELQKPGRSSQSLVAFAKPLWSDAHIDHDQASVQAAMLHAVSECLNQDVSHADYVSLHRWRYARLTDACDTEYVFDEGLKQAACGDWCLNGDVESAVLSALKLYDALSERLVN